MPGAFTRTLPDISARNIDKVYCLCKRGIVAHIITLIKILYCLCKRGIVAHIITLIKILYCLCKRGINYPDQNIVLPL